MLPPWRDHITALVSPEQVSVVAERRAWRKGPSACVGHACSSAPAAVAVPAALARALGQLGQLEDRGAWTPRPLVRLVLSHHLAALALVPHARALQDAMERQAAARHALAAVHGPATADWRIVVDPSRADTALAAGLDGPLIEGLRSAVTEAGMALQSVEPLFAAATASAASSLQSGAAWLVIAEPGRVVLARYEARAWRSLRTHRPRRSLAADLGAWIDQARVIDGVAGADRVIVAGTQAHELESLDRPSWSVTQAPLFAWLPVNPVAEVA